MEIKDNILRDINEENNIYFIDLETGIKAEAYYLVSKKQIVLIRGEIEKEDIKRAESQVDLIPLKKIDIKDISRIIDIMKRLLANIKKDNLMRKKYPEVQCIEFHVEDYTYIDMLS